jgi:hypothetical protein
MLNADLAASTDAIVQINNQQSAINNQQFIQPSALNIQHSS